ncbi:glycoside hydrolase family 32 protein [Paenibacillus phocaensis]|uniref:glycoside hydrolase family 32 protein n=1 Tax=Paenibacillus phocaensis TaxID=1776378 RepID=UPI000839CF74|nr:glycoside hydrolase family 32 protein [Paenibacillus phocaensis]
MTLQQGSRERHALALAKAEAAIAAIREEAAREPSRHKYHFMAPARWVNDPNGLIQFKGEYHLFYQYYPYGDRWGAMHWGHAQSKDLVHWEHLPIALAPSEPYDLDERGGCFSGSAVDDNGVLSLLYTGTVIRDGQAIQTQCLATSSDGIHFEKYEGNPVIALPPEEGSADFRDPKVWKHDDTWYMVVGTGKDGRGKALLYRSPDLRKWDYVGVLAESDGSLGTMWECPDFFPLGDKHVLLFSPMGMGNTKTVYLVGDMDYERGIFTWDVQGEVDFGFDYYAPQSLLDDQGRRIIIAWLNSWDWMPWFKDFAPPSQQKWCGSMSIPRTVELDADGKLKFLPVAELASLREEGQVSGEQRIAADTEKVLARPEGNAWEMIAEFDLASCEAEEFGLKLRVSADGTKETVLSYTPATGMLRFDRSRSDGWSEGSCECQLEAFGQTTLKLRILMDTSVVEIFADNGRTVMTYNLFPHADSVGTRLFSRGGSVNLVSLQCWTLRPVW